MTENNLSPFDPERFVGTVVQVEPASVQLTLPEGVDTSGGHSQSANPVSATVSDFVVVAVGNYAVFGQLTDIWVPENQKSAVGSNKAVEVVPLGLVKLLTSIDIETGKVYPGILCQPRIGSKAYFAHAKLIQSLVEAPNNLKDSSDRVKLSVVELGDTDHTIVSFTPEMLFGRHLAVLGATGSGKSWSLARIVEQSAIHKAKVILFDATGEYADLSEKTHHVHLGDDPKPREGSKEVALPYFQLTESDLFAIFNPTGQSQAPKLRGAMKSLKLVALNPAIGIGGTVVKANKSKVFYEDEYRHYLEDIESPFADFDIRKLTSQIENECVHPRRSATEPKFWGDYNGIDQAYCVPLITRIQDIIKSKDLAPIFSPKGKTSLIEEIESFLEDDSVSVFRVSMQYLSFSHNAREIIANATGRYLLQLARDGVFRRLPLLIVLDEAHQFVDKTLGDEFNTYPLDSFALIAKEGRKYSLSICISTQRPRDIPEGVLSQMGTLVVHRLINDKDRAVVERACGEMDSASLASLPALAPGEAVIIGVDFPVPMSIKIAPPKAKPNSRGPDYQKYWG